MKMKNYLRWMILSILLCAGCSFALAMSPVGQWKTIDDASGKARSIVEIETVNGKLQGKILQVFLRQGEKPKDQCKKCQGALHNKPIIGMTFLWGLEKTKDNLWKNGYVLDPHNGKIYRAEIALGNQGRTLTIRGYIGIPLFGRSQTWLRVNAQP
ncbi:MAG: DUF2147 domain-containing protein [Legionellales bacterium]|nr:DUF2147 domain-containing protein [Legionellales bacterium]